LSREIEALGEAIMKNQYLFVSLHGFASVIGPSSLNQKLSIARAQTVADALKKWLIAHGDTKVAVSFTGQGATNDPQLGTGRVVVVSPHVPA
jgi:outer membrane protein OmpA-like peptidoglycan-associated protein